MREAASRGPQARALERRGAVIGSLVYVCPRCGYSWRSWRIHIACPRCGRYLPR